MPRVTRAIMTVSGVGESGWRCSHCRYDLTGLDTDEEQRIRCPECGSLCHTRHYSGIGPFWKPEPQGAFDRSAMQTSYRSLNVFEAEPIRRSSHPIERCGRCGRIVSGPGLGPRGPLCPSCGERLDSPGTGRGGPIMKIAFRLAWPQLIGVAGIVGGALALWTFIHPTALKVMVGSAAVLFLALAFGLLTRELARPGPDRWNDTRSDRWIRTMEQAVADAKAGNFNDEEIARLVDASEATDGLGYAVIGLWMAITFPLFLVIGILVAIII